MYLSDGACACWSLFRHRAHALMPCLGSLLAILPWAGVMYSPHFATAMLCLLLEYLAAEGWLGPALTILQVYREAPLTSCHSSGSGDMCLSS